MSLDEQNPVGGISDWHETSCRIFYDEGAACSCARLHQVPMTPPSQPTPGPWKAVWDDDGQDYRLSVVKDDDIAPEIAKVFTENVSDAQAEADARLIAAAPDLRFEIQTSMEDINTAIDNSRVWTREQLVKHLMELQRRQSALLARIAGKDTP